MIIQIKNRRDRAIYLLLFAFSVLLHYYLGSFLKKPTIYWDELYYYSMARSIFRGTGLLIRNKVTSFQKILYPLVLSPLFSVNNAELRIRLITLLNAVLISSALFPFLGICRELKVTEKKTTLLGILFVLWPELLISETFMSESLYWPLLFCFVYLWLREPIKHKQLQGAAEGALLYLGFLCKEVFAAFLPVYLLCAAIEWKGEENKASATLWKRFASCLLSFCLLFLLAKLTLFRNMGKSYNQSDIAVLFTNANQIYIVYSVFYHFCAVLLSVQLLPVFLPVMYFRSLERKQRQLFTLIFSFILFVILGIAYAISIREDSGLNIPRLHLRYMAPAVFLLFPLLAVCPSPEGNPEEKEWMKVLPFFALLTAVFFRGAKSTAFDQYSLQWISALSSFLSECCPDDSLLPELLIRLVVGLFLGGVVWLFSRSLRKEKDVFLPFLCFLLVPVLFSDFWGQRAIHEDYSCDRQQWESTCALSDYFSDTDDHVLLLVYDSNQYRQSKIIDACFDPAERLYFLTWFHAEEDRESEAVRDYRFSVGMDSQSYAQTDRIDYLIIPASAKLEVSDPTQYEPVSELSDEWYSVYRNTIPDMLPLSFNNVK